MKKLIALLTACVTLICITAAFGCGTANETTKIPTSKNTTSAQTTESTSTEKTKESTKTTTTESETFITTEPMIDPMFPLPDIADPFTDIAPNIPESGTDGNGALGDIFDGTNGNDGWGDINGDMDTRGRGRRDANMTNPALPTK